jgi:hypothetical protein
VAVQITAVFPDLSRAIRKAAARQIEERGKRYGETMVTAVKASISSQLDCGRPASRRRSPGSQHLNEGWDFKVVGDPVNYPLYVNLFAEGDAAYMRRVHMMSEGTGGHVIRPHRAGGPKGAWLKFPGEDGTVYTRQAVHPGTRKYSFLEAAQAFATGRAARSFR